MSPQPFDKDGLHFLMERRRILWCRSHLALTIADLDELGGRKRAEDWCNWYIDELSWEEVKYLFHL